MRHPHPRWIPRVQRRPIHSQELSVKLQDWHMPFFFGTLNRTLSASRITTKSPPHNRLANLRIPRWPAKRVPQEHYRLLMTSLPTDPDVHIGSPNFCMRPGNYELVPFRHPKAESPWDRRSVAISILSKKPCAAANQMPNQLRRAAEAITIN